MEISKEQFKSLKEQTKDFYTKIGKLKCPYLGSEVHFNEDGFNHLLAKSWNRGRSLKEQYIRLKLVPFVVKIVKLSHTLQEFDESKVFVRQKINSRWEKRLKTVRYYVFIAFLKERTASLILPEYR